jgi:hypothetical protein
VKFLPSEAAVLAVPQLNPRQQGNPLPLVPKNLICTPQKPWFDSFGRLRYKLADMKVAGAGGVLSSLWSSILFALVIYP